MPAPLPCQGTGIIRLPGPPQVGSSSRPLSRLQVTVKMRSIRAILITGSCISQKHVCSKEQQAKRRKKIFSPCRRLSSPPPCRQPPITGSQVSKNTSGEFSLFQRVLIWHQILYFPCKYLKQKHFQAPWAVWKVTGHASLDRLKTFGLCIIHGESVVIKQRPLGNVGLFGYQVSGLSAPEVWKWLHDIILIKGTT